ncbi:MAG: alpha/beta fold hydrolase [Planctomyces sp.]|nr:alpha/beta fold hydrolase [Planctomyces sp.]
MNRRTMKFNSRILLCLLTGIVVHSQLLAAADPEFRVIAINPRSEHHSCAIADIDGDGTKDIIAGGWWYEAPAWTPHFVRDVEVIRGRFDDYSHLPLDVNGDGFTDFISVNYRSESMYWVEHPGLHLEKAERWTTHTIDRPGAMETGRLCDIDGDGQPDILPNGVKFSGWWRFQPAAVPGTSSVWQRHSLPDELAAHGIGFGDVNGDGRGDIIGQHGWAEAPEDRISDRWIFHNEFELWRDASIPILAFDVDQDGDQDIVWGRGHRIGLYWLEQQQEEDQQRRWMRHAIDTEWSQAHSLLTADLDGDGRDDLIAGSRYLGHDGKDVGESNPLRGYWYNFDAQRRSWSRHQITEGQGVGFGLDPKADDIDQDGDIDLICADRCGVFLLENLRVNAGTEVPTDSHILTSDEVKPSASRYKDHTKVMMLRDASDQETPITTPEQMGIRRAHILDGMMEAMGPFPSPEQRVPLDIRVESEEMADGYLRKRISFASEPDDRVPAWLLIPNGKADRGAAMLCLHQTIGIGKGEPAGLGGSRNLHYAHELAQRGFVCVVPDYPSFGDYEYDFRTKGSHYKSGSMKAIWNNVRAIDVLESLPEVDPDRIGCVGHSLGGHNTLFTAAFDQRIRAAVTSCGFTAFHHYYEGNLAGWTSDRYMPRIRDLYGNDPNRVPFDFHEVFSAIAPRSVFVNAPLRDSNFDNPGVRKVIEESQKAYGIYKADQNALVAKYPDCEHDFPPEVREEAWKWLEDRLKE